MRQKRAIKSKWDGVKDTFVPLDGELIIYKDGWKGEQSTPTIYVGDGATKLSSLNPVGTYKHTKSLLSWDETVTVGQVGADAITVSLPKPTFAATNDTGYKGQSVVSLEFTAGKTPQTIDICNPSNTDGIWYDSDNGTINMDAPPTNHASSDTTYGIATDTLYGHVKVANVRTTTISNPHVNAQHSDGAKYYGVERDANGVTFVALPNASNDTSGLARTGYIGSGREYGVKADDKGNLYVNVPWTDSYHEPSCTTGLKIATGFGKKDLLVPTATDGSLGVVKLGYKTYANEYAVQSNNNGDLYVYIPEATITQYGVVKPASTRSSFTATYAAGGTTGRYYGVELDKYGKMFVNVPPASKDALGVSRVWYENSTLYIYNT